MTSLYIELTQFINNRLNTGIQRVVAEFLLRALDDTKYKLYILYYDTIQSSYKLLSNKETKLFLDDTKHYTFKKFKPIDIFDKKTKNKIFFDIDSVWNAPLKREKLYKKLKKNNFKIQNFIYDLIPILYPKYMHKETRKNFPKYLKAIYKYSHKVFFDSYSAKEDFLSIQKKYLYSKHIDTKVAHLGSNFLSTKAKFQKRYKRLLSKQYILFVGTIEPRKQHSLLLDTYDDIVKKHPKLNIVFIGKIGWNVEKFVNKLNTHKLKDKTIHHLQDINDTTLKAFYKNAFLVTYLSKYEGYGLPIAESLQYGNITIVSKNSSMQEVGKDNVDYIKNNSKKQLKNIIKSYLNNKKYYIKAKEKLRLNYNSLNWNDFYKQTQ